MKRRNCKMKKSKVLKVVKEYKKEILIGAGTMISIGLLSYLGIKHSKKNSICIPTIEPIKTTNYVVKGIDRVDRYSENCLDLWLEGSKLSELGTLGKNIKEGIPNTTSDTMVYGIMQILDFKEES